MTQRLNLARAAHLVGVPRATLQRLIRAGELAAPDGFVSVDQLQRLFPQAALEEAGDDSARVARIRQEAFGRRVRERLLPSQEVLAQRLLAQGQELADLRRCAQAYHALVVDTLARLREPSGAGPSCAALAERMEAGLKQILGAEPAGPLETLATVMGVVAAHVTLRPGGRTFLVEGNDSILQAGLKAGARFAYGCGTGTCGLCKARVVSGQTRQVGAADYPLSAQEREQGYRLLCAHTAATDVVIETLEALGPDDVPEQHIEAKVRAITPLGSDTLLLHLQTPRSSRLRFLAGQAVTLGVAAGGGDATATWPLASCPCDERNLHFHVARAADDALASLLFGGRLAAGATVNLRGPTGRFVMAGDESRPLLLFACDTGFAPVKSLIEHALAAEQVESIALHWLATRADGHYLANACRAWDDAFEQFAYVPATAADAAAGGRDLVRRAIEADAGWRSRPVFVAGPAAFADAVLFELQDAGADPGLLHDYVT
jgi:CDP-4-dehydro-6-deoxyglucose reductase